MNRRMALRAGIEGESGRVAGIVETRSDLIAGEVRKPSDDLFGRRSCGEVAQDQAAGDACLFHGLGLLQALAAGSVFERAGEYLIADFIRPATRPTLSPLELPSGSADDEAAGDG